MLPTSPWESIWRPLATWIGVEPEQLGKVLPNLHAFGAQHIPRQQDVFVAA